MSAVLEPGATTEGRLSWGVDDFDESYPLPYTNDLVRLAASVRIVIIQLFFFGAEFTKSIQTHLVLDWTLNLTCILLSLRA